MSRSIRLCKTYMLLNLFVSALSGTRCTSPTIARMGRICITLVSSTIQMNTSIHSVTPCRILYIVEITILFSWAWDSNINGWVFLQCWEKDDVIFPASRHSSIWIIEFCVVLLKYNTNREGSHPWKDVSWSFSSLCVYSTSMLWYLGTTPWLALVYSLLQLSPRSRIPVELWKS